MRETPRPPARAISFDVAAAAGTRLLLGIRPALISFRRCWCAAGRQMRDPLVSTGLERACAVAAHAVQVSEARRVISARAAALLPYQAAEVQPAGGSGADPGPISGGSRFPA